MAGLLDKNSHFTRQNWGKLPRFRAETVFVRRLLAGRTFGERKEWYFFCGTGG